MYLLFHGGKCCGIKTVYYLGTDPASKVGSLEKTDDRDTDANGGNVSSCLPFFTAGAPEETGEARLERYIAYMKKRRPRNILEVTIARSRHSFMDQGRWVPVLEKLGFKMVTEAPNSNSQNIVQIWHLVVDDGKHKPFDFLKY